ncbi:MAG: F0F1 ATP synthase subunit delta, partial [Candidatus Acidiferrum sp.]
MKSASLQYATALADVVLEQGAAEPARKQLEDFRAAYEESAELRNVLASPAIAREAKHGVIEKLVVRMGGSRIIRNFLFVMSDNQRVHLLPEIVHTFEQVLR